MQIETNRLILEPLTVADVDNLFALDSDANVVKYLARPPANDKEFVRQLIDKKIDYNRRHAGLGYWTLIEKKSNSFVGQFSLAHIEFDEKKEIEIGFRFLPYFWGRGFATEMGKEVLRHGFDHVKLERIVGLTHPHNLASQKVLDKIGLKYTRDDFYYGTQVMVFEITKSIPAFKTQ
jgi:[ribosomal protein S5]-alanine N-acetyltransferase